MPLPRLRILIVDDTAEHGGTLREAVLGLGHEAILAGNGAEAIAAYESTQPDLVFLDITRPLVDGFATLRRIRDLAADKWTPILLSSPPERMDDVMLGLEAGGDDFITRPVSRQVLSARINSHARMLSLRQEARANAEELRNWRLEAEEQSRLGAHVMDRLTDTASLRDPMVRHFNLPADTFSGDLICAARAPGEVLNVLLADAAGHGLAAALSAMPLTQVFYSMTEKGFPLPSIAEELNRKLKAILPSDRFVAATLASVDVRNQTVEVWNGGNPDALYINAHGDIAMQWNSVHPPLGILPEPLFSGLTETVVFREPGDLVLCSDGLTEAEDGGGGWFGIQGVHSHLAGARSSAQRFNCLRDGIRAHLAGRPARDDISALLVSVPIDRRRQIRFDTPPQAHRGHLSEWRLDLSFGAEELRYVDVVPAVLGFATQLQALKPHQGALFLIFSELFNNALDHGLLGLDSATKSWIGGFELYMRQRGERLARLRHGRIDLSLLLHQEDSRAVLDISLTDTGPGFDFESWLARASSPEPSTDQTHGRGIALVRNLCEQMVYSGHGNKVWARYLVSDRIVEANEIDNGGPDDAPRPDAPGDDTDLVLF